MHFPEMWGFVQFTEIFAGEGKVFFKQNPDERYKWLLRKLYYAQQEYRINQGEYATDKESLNYRGIVKNLFGDETPPPNITMQVLDNHYIIRLQPENMETNFYIRSDSKVWKTHR